jgi:hypothetical protein
MSRKIKEMKNNMPTVIETRHLLGIKLPGMPIILRKRSTSSESSP